jgi:hypothetical protein
VNAIASVSDSLELILRLTQLNTFVRGFQLITQVIGAAEEAFIAYDSAILRSQFFLNEFGHSLPTAEIAEFARTLSLSTGESQTAIVSLTGYLARFRASAQEIERADQVLTNASLATGVSLERMGHLIERARQGHARGLWDELGIQVKGLDGQLYSLNQIIDIVDQHTSGFAAQWGETLPGSLAKTKAAFEDMMVSLGQLLSPAILATANSLAAIFETIADSARSFAESLGIALPSLGTAGAAAAAGGGGNANRVEQYLQAITFNTGPQGPLGRALLGGGSYSEPGGGLHIRDFNVMMRSAT